MFNRTCFGQLFQVPLSHRTCIFDQRAAWVIPRHLLTGSRTHSAYWFLLANGLSPSNPQRNSASLSMVVARWRHQRASLYSPPQATSGLTSGWLRNTWLPEFRGWRIPTLSLSSCRFVMFAATITLFQYLLCVEWLGSRWRVCIT